MRLEPGVDFVYAPLPARVLAYLLDVFASGVMMFLVNRFLRTALTEVLGAYSFMGQSLGMSLLFMVGLGYWVVTPAMSGATPGKIIFHLRIVPETDQPMRLVQVLLREVVGHALLLASAGIGFLIALQDPKMRALNDRLSRTRLIQLTPPRPVLYKVQDLRVIDDEGTLMTDEAKVVKFMARGSPAVTVAETPQATAEPAPVDAVDEAGLVQAADDAVVDAVGTVAEEPGTEPDTGPPVTEPVKEPAPAPGPATPPPKRPAAAPIGETLYARREGETAQDRKLRAALGPTVEELAIALRRTADLVLEGSLAPKVLDRKRDDFVEKMRTIDLGESPDEAIKIIIELSREELLTPAELQQIRDILRGRLSNP
jgi:uncharacterized RDD family membrane protein YckC